MRINLRNPLKTSNSIQNRPKTPTKCDFYFAKYATMLFKSSLVFVCGEHLTEGGEKEEEERELKEGNRRMRMRSDMVQGKTFHQRP